MNNRFKVIIDCDERVEAFKCDIMDVDKEKKVVCFTVRDGRYIDREWYEFSSYNITADCIMFKGGKFVSNRYK